VLEDVDNEVLVTESLMRLTNRNFDNLDLDENTVTDTDFPQTNAFLNEHILPRMLAYLNDCWGLDAVQYTYNAWVRVTTDGQGMKLHEHSGSVLSAIYYPMACSGGAINLVDPRGSACRGYPTQVRNDHFNLFSEVPKEGLLVIFPSYLQHYVDGHDKDMRVSIPVDIYLQEPT
jgi:uncharacterized protein (TIGR02466 family)